MNLVLTKTEKIAPHTEQLVRGERGHKRSSFCGASAKKIAKSATCGFQSYNSVAVASSRQPSSYLVDSKL